jgi:hypothetical protein
MVLNATWCSVQTFVFKQGRLKSLVREVYRLLLGFPGGLALANLFAAAVAAVLGQFGMPTSEGLTTGLLLAYLGLPAWLLWVYCTGSLFWTTVSGLVFGMLSAAFFHLMI